MLVYFTVSLIALLGFTGLAIDVGRMELATIQLQAVADDAAMTAATEFNNGNTNWQTVGAAEATSAGAVDGLPSVASTFQLGADAGPYASDQSVVQATVTQQISFYFIQLVTGITTKTLTAKAVAQFQPCSYFTGTDPNLGYSVSVLNAHPFDSKVCPVYLGNFNLDNASTWYDLQIKATGTSSASTNAGYMQAVPLYQQATMTDPLAYNTAPVFSACTTGDKSLNITSTTTLSPGTYCGGLTIGNYTTVNMQPGLYIITGGFSLGLGSTLNGTGVTLYFTQGGGSGFGTILFGNSNYMVQSYVNLTAPTDSSAGGTPGIMLWVDAAWTAVNGVQITNCIWSGNGLVYSKNAGVTAYYSVMKNFAYFGFVAPYFTDNTTPMHIVNDFSSLTTGNPFHTPVVLVQ